MKVFGFCIDFFHSFIHEIFMTESKVIY